LPRHDVRLGGRLRLHDLFERREWPICIQWIAIEIESADLPRFRLTLECRGGGMSFARIEHIRLIVRRLLLLCPLDLNAADALGALHGIGARCWITRGRFPLLSVWGRQSNESNGHSPQKNDRAAHRRTPLGDWLNPVAVIPPCDRGGISSREELPAVNGGSACRSLPTRDPGIT
jgi:hypothetical protein